MLKNMMIANKITVGFTVIILILIALGTSGIYNARSTAQMVNQLLSTDLVYGIGMTDVTEDVLLLRRYEKDLFINISDSEKTKDYKKKWDKTLSDIKGTLEQLNSVASDKQRADLQMLLSEVDQYEAGFNEVAAAINNGQITTPQDANKAMDKHKVVVRKLSEDADEKAEEAIAAVNSIKEKVASDGQKTFQTSLVLIIVAITAAVSAAYFIGQSVRKPLADIQREINEIDQTGQIGRRLKVVNQDEIGQTSDALNRLFTGMSEVIKLANHNSAALLAVSRELASASSQVSNASQIQTESAGSSAAAIEQMSVSVHMIAHNANTMESESRDAAKTAIEGAATAKRAATEINQIAASINQSSEIIVQLNQRSDEIGSIAMVIKDIADQTNLLALNAAIEAARAGDLGRGFAVVADEVRKLAERTTQATIEITSKIDSVQRDTSAAAEGMRNASMLVDNGVRSTESVAEALSLIEGVTGRNVEHIASISQAITEQSAASQEIARHVEHIAQASGENHDAAKSTDELSARLSHIAQELDNTIKRFTV